jgi:uncharacterized cupredoxin-like copper-binding protein
MKRVVLTVTLAVAIGLPLAASARTAAISTIGVKASEFKFALTIKTAPRGLVVFKITNVGHLKHDFAIAGKKSPMIAPGKSATLRVNFKRAGSFPYRCTVPGHAAAGMKGVLTVT